MYVEILLTAADIALGVAVEAAALMRRFPVRFWRFKVSFRAHTKKTATASITTPKNAITSPSDTSTKVFPVG